MILVLNGSPNLDGNTTSVLNKILEDSSDEVKIINAYQENITPCNDCKYCNYKKGCSKDDKMQEIYHLLEQADTFILATPLYFATLSGPLVNLISRMQTYFAGKFVRNDENPKINKGLLLVTAGGFWPTMFNGVNETFNIMKLLFNIDDTKEILITNCDEVKPLSNDKVLLEINECKKFLF